MNKETAGLISDFYLLEYISSSNKEFLNEPSVIKFKDDLIFELKTILEYAIIEELSFIWWEGNTLASTWKYAEIHEFLNRTIPSKSARLILEDFLPGFVNNLTSEGLSGKQAELLKDTEKLKHYCRVIQSDISPAKFIKSTKQLFTKISWNTQYGGNKWEKIANLYEELLTNDKDLFRIVDTIFWFQHNTASLFDKIPSWKGNNGTYKWLDEFLTFRHNVENVWDLVNSSKRLKKISMKYLKKNGEGTLEDYTENKVKIPSCEDVIKEAIGKVEQNTQTNYENIKTEFSREVEELKRSLGQDKEDILNTVTTINDKLNSLEKDIPKLNNSFIMIMNEQVDIYSEITKTSGIELKDKITVELNKLSEHFEKVTIAHGNILDNHITQMNQRLEKMETSTVKTENKFDVIIDFLVTMEKDMIPWYKKLWKIIKF